MNHTNHVLLPLLFSVLLLPATARGQRLAPQKGNASYYADRFHGRKMSNGDKYHRDSMTCAHLRYPLGTRLLVRNITNGKEVVVTVTDRGPYSRKFVIDLSRAAAKALDIIRYGYRTVEITPFTEGEIPYKYEPTKERPELSLGYTTDREYGPPYWQDDSIYQARIKHHFGKSAMARRDSERKDSLRASLHRDTTLRERAVSHAKMKTKPEGKKRK